MKFLYSLLLTCGFFLVSACSSDNDTSEVHIRLFNASSFDYRNIVVASTTYEDLNAGQRSEYQLFEMAYRYAFVQLEIDGKTFTIQPIDFVGESLLKNGFYTYRLDANDSPDQYGKLSISLIED